jgi:hypothetical protein
MTEEVDNKNPEDLDKNKRIIYHCNDDRLSLSIIKCTCYIIDKILTLKGKFKND